ncbi:hypothetical protein [Arthrobacter sp. NEB 688]|uniref:hypothetical protein n=1 Tax=Arthrobacter sp. NEB 688 TaxID=904039 RepID=UPI001563A051|nr:hypothetical protein [Arthrobacter sp. NEB 688]QKE82893.1 hypothetical protein HL663_02285 [Arthrobacter sp. NEB 688]
MTEPGKLSARAAAELLGVEALQHAERLALELEELLRESEEPVLYFGDEPGASWVCLWRELDDADYQLAIAISTEDSSRVQEHVRAVLVAVVGLDLVDSGDDVVLLDWASADVADGSQAQLATALALAVVAGYDPPIELEACHWTGPQYTDEQIATWRTIIESYEDVEK